MSASVKRKRPRPTRCNAPFCVGAFLLALTLPTLLQDSQFLKPLMGDFQASSQVELTEQSDNQQQSHDHSLSSSRLEYCIKHRGYSGNWYVNQTMSRETFHPYGFRSMQWYKRNKNNASAVYPGNQYAWNDTTVHDGSNCGAVTPVNHDRFCSVMKRLQIQRLMFIGDSLVQSQMKSLLNLLGYNVADFVAVKKRDVIKKSTLDCPDYPPISLYYTRENLGPNLRDADEVGNSNATIQQLFDSETPYCSEKQGASSTPMSRSYHCPWIDAYTSSEEKTLLILNQGPHFHSLKTFSDSFDLFLQQFGEVARKNDIVIYRDTVAGHDDCFNNNDHAILPPDMTHDKFLNRYATTTHDWNLFADYNAYAKDHFLNRLKGVSNKIYLNAYNMTVLRADQHISASDCLHYFFPGPMDFWNHLLFTNLADLADLQAEIE